MTGLIVLHNGVVKLKNRKVDSVTTDYRVLSDGRIPRQIKPQKTRKITYVAQA